MGTNRTGHMLPHTQQNARMFGPCPVHYPYPSCRLGMSRHHMLLVLAGCVSIIHQRHKPVVNFGVFMRADDRQDFPAQSANHCRDPA